MAEVRLDFHWDGLDGVKERIDRIRDAISPPSITESLGIGADIFVDEARGFAPKLTGALSESIGKTRDGEGMGWLVSPFANNAGDVYLYAATQEFGGHHEGNPWMTWEGPTGPVWKREVDIPGTEYMQRAFDAGVDPATEAITTDITAKAGLD